MINEQGIKPSSGGWLKQLFARPFERPGVRSAALYLGTVLIGVLIVASLFDLRKSVRGYPYDYLGDTLFYHSMVKGVIDHGWYLTNPSLGAPGVLDMRDVPSSDNNFHMVLVKLLALRNKHYPGVLNNFFLLTFPLTIIAALYALRRLGVSWTVSSWAALLFTMLPYHFTRGEQHLFLAAYWQIPLLVLVLLWICRAELWTFEQTQRWPRVNWRDRRLLGALALCVGLLLCVLCLFLFADGGSDRGVATAARGRFRGARSTDRGDLSFCGVESAAEHHPSLTARQCDGCAARGSGGRGVRLAHRAIADAGALASRAGAVGFEGRLQHAHLHYRE
jgi:hypothetical protein